jgi:hypothetical protein
MKAKQKYQTILIAVLVAFVYLLLTEVAGRWSSTIQDYGILLERQKIVLKPDELDKKKVELSVQKNLLSAKLTGGNRQYEQSQVGVVNFLDASAKGANILLCSLTPLESKTAAQMVEHGFRMEIIGTYHRLGTFINSLETGAIPIRVTKIEMTSQHPGSSIVTAMIEGKAFVLLKDEMR